jgi:hypothetical protein
MFYLRVNVSRILRNPDTACTHARTHARTEVGRKIRLKGKAISLQAWTSS